jgi:Ras family protein T1
MTTLLDYKTTLAYLAYLGYEDPSFSSAAAADASAFQVTTTSALKVVPAGASEADIGKKGSGKKNNQITKNRNVFLCYVIGATGSGKTALLRNFIQKSFTKSYSPTLKPYSVVNSTQIQGMEKYLVLMELGTNYDHEILQNKKKMGLCDLILYVYDSSDVHSFSYVANIRVRGIA